MDWLKQRLTALGRWLILLDYVGTDTPQDTLMHDLRHQCQKLRNERDQLRTALIVQTVKNQQGIAAKRPEEQWTKTP